MAAASSPAASEPQQINTCDEGAKSAFKSATASLGYGALSTASTKQGGAHASEQGKATMNRGAPSARTSLSARIMKIGASDSEPSDDEAFVSGSNYAKGGTRGASSAGLQDEGGSDSDSF